MSEGKDGSGSGLLTPRNVCRLLAAGPVWLAWGRGFGRFGKAGTVAAPLVNLASGLYLWQAAGRLERGVL